MEEARAAFRILVIDDEPSLVKAYRRMLEPPYAVHLAHGGAEGLSILAREPPFDAILCDLMMPDVDGVDIYNAVAAHPDRVRRLIFCSGGAVTDRTRDFMATVANVVLEKPVSRAHLLTAIEAVLV